MFCSYQIIWVVYEFLIAITTLEVCDVKIMLQIVILSLYTFSIVMYQGLFWDFR